MKDAVEVPKSIPELQDIVVSQQEEIAHLKQQYANLLEQIKLEKLHRYGRKSESHVSQLTLDLFDEAESEDEKEQTASEQQTQTITYERGKPKRKPLPKHLPREEIVHDIDDKDKVCACGCEKNKIGEEVSEQLEVIPASLKVVAHIRPKYACNRCDASVATSPMPELFLPKHIATPSLVAYTLINKFQDHLPLYRQAQMWKRLNVDIPRNTMSNWIMKAYEICEPLKDALIKELLSTDYLQVDETPVQVLKESGRNNTSKSYIWVYRSARPDKKLILYDYQPTRQGLWPEQILSEFEGYLQTDGYKGYDWAKDKANIIQLGCMAHARRPFAELVKIAKSVGKSHQAVAYIKKLYAIEKQARLNNLSPDARKALRLEKALPILEALFKWVKQSLLTAVPQSKLAKGLNYINDRQQSLSNYLLDGRLEIDNNGVENKIRPLAIGRKNWLFSGSPKGANASCFFYSLINSATDNGLNPFSYLMHVFNNIKKCKSDADFIALLPHKCVLSE
jgi:transposase